MVMLITRMHEIADREGFEIEVTRKGKVLKNLRRNGVLNAYPSKRKLGGAKTVDHWKRERFESINPGYSCNVLKGDGKAMSLFLLKFAGQSDTLLNFSTSSGTFPGEGVARHCRVGFAWSPQATFLPTRAW